MSLEKIKEDVLLIQELLDKEDSKNKRETDKQIIQLIKNINNSVQEEKNAK